MSAVLLFGIFFALLFLNVPIAMSLGVSSIITTMAVKPAMMSTIAANLYSSTNTYVLLAIPFILFYMKQEIFAPMTALVSTMDRIGRGELSVRSSVDYRNAEFTQVNETFNRMIDQITQLKIDGYEKELEARRNEMTALKLQIRPHFVLNCLKSVYAMVQTGSREDAQQLILLLSRYLRYILSFTATTTPLHTEIEQCCNYAELSSVGQNDPVEVVCEIDPELSELPLPPVSLPLSKRSSRRKSCGIS